MAEPGRSPGIVEPGTEVQVGTAGGGRRGARRGAEHRARANFLACNFLATEPVPERTLRGFLYRNGQDVSDFRDESAVQPVPGNNRIGSCTVSRDCRTFPWKP